MMRSLSNALVFWTLFAWTPQLQSQPLSLPAENVYRDSVLATIRIYIHPDSLRQIFLHDSLESDYEYPAVCVFENGTTRDSITQIGFRIRGNTSRYSQKKSFKISFNTFVKGQSLHGIEKLNINGEHNDPSIIRAKICWDLFRQFGVPASRANHARLFINNAYYGLYISVEHIDENFALSRFGNNDGNLYKCLWPASLISRGTTPAAYRTFMNAGRRVYELKTNEVQDNYSDLADFITFLNSSTSTDFATEIEDRFNVPNFLKILAVGALVGSWDDYWFNQNNYYLYRNTATDRFEFIPYDYDNTFGIWWEGILPGTDWGTRNLYSWGHPSEARPLTQRILSIPKYRNWYSYYVRQLLANHSVTTTLFPRIDSLHTRITAAAEADTIRTKDYGYTIPLFHNSYTQALGAHVLYGLKPFITTRRSSALSQVEQYGIAPIIYSVWHASVGIDSIRVLARVEDDAPGMTVTAYREEPEQNFTTFDMFDDGLHGDGTAGDGVFGGVIPRPSSGAATRYAVGAVDASSAQSLSPSSAPARLYTAGGISLTSGLRINEFMASNSLTIKDEFGTADDWIEIYNSTGTAVSLKGKYLTDNLAAPSKWAFPDTTIPANGYILVWADDQVAQGKMHAPYKLDKASEQVGLFDSTAAGFVAIDSVTYGAQQTDVSWARIPNGTGALGACATPTPGQSNTPPSGIADGANIPTETRILGSYPNPFNPNTVVSYWLLEVGEIDLRVYDILGRQVGVLAEGIKNSGLHTATFDASELTSGIYICRLTAGGTASSIKMMRVN